MSVLKPLSTYSKVLDNDLNQYMIQIDLSDQRISDVTAVYIDQTGTLEVFQASKSENIEQSFYDMVNSDDHDSIYYQFKNDILHIVADETKIAHAGDSFYFTATRYAQPILSLEDDIDLPQDKIPLFVNKVLANLYHLQGKEAPLTIKRKIKELE